MNIYTHANTRRWRQGCIWM